MKKKITDFLPNGGLLKIAREDCGTGFEVTIVAHELDQDGSKHGYISATPPDLASTVKVIEDEMSYPIRMAREVTPRYSEIETARDRAELERLIAKHAPARFEQ